MQSNTEQCKANATQNTAIRSSATQHKAICLNKPSYTHSKRADSKLFEISEPIQNEEQIVDQHLGLVADATAASVNATAAKVKLTYK